MKKFISKKNDNLILYIILKVLKKFSKKKI